MSAGNPYPLFFDDLTDAQNVINDDHNTSDAPTPAVVDPYPQSQAGSSSGTGTAVGPTRFADLPSSRSQSAPYTRRPHSIVSQGGQVQPPTSNVPQCKSSLIPAGQIGLIDHIHRSAISTDQTSFAEEWNTNTIMESELAGRGGQMGATVASSAGPSSSLAPHALMYVAPIPLLSLQILIVSDVLA
jgi:hypothetical protein